VTAAGCQLWQQGAWKGKAQLWAAAFQGGLKSPGRVMAAPKAIASSTSASPFISYWGYV